MTFSQWGLDVIPLSQLLQAVCSTDARTLKMGEFEMSTCTALLLTTIFDGSIPACVLCQQSQPGPPITLGSWKI